MDVQDRFEQNRPRLRAVAYRMLGSTAEADDAVQESWLRLNRTGADGIDNLDAWLTTVVGRVCLDMLRNRGSRHEVTITQDQPAASPNPEDEAMLADSVGLALLVVLETLTPAERLAFVLHDLFAVPFDEVAPIVGRSPDAARQLASRARRRVRAHPTERPAGREVVDAFLAASREGNFEALVALLHPDVVLRADQAAVRAGADEEVRGAAAVAGSFSGRAVRARPALVDGAAGAVWAPGGRPRVVFGFTTADGRIVAIDLLADPERLDAMRLTVLGD